MSELRGERVKRFGEMHAQARYDAGKSQEYMSLELGVSKKTVQNWEKGIGSPSFFESLEWFRVLGRNPMPYYFSIIYPKKMSQVKFASTDAEVEDAFDTLIKQISTNDKRALLYLYFGNHGSSPHSLIQLLLAHLHAPLKLRFSHALSVVNDYKLSKDLGELCDADEILPDMEDLNRAIMRANVALLRREYGYNNLDKMMTDSEEENSAPGEPNL